MAAVVTQTLEAIHKPGGGDTLKLTFAWTSHTDGAASASTDVGTFMGRKITDLINGRELLMGEVIPGTITPTDEFDIVISDHNGADLFSGEFGNCTNAAATTSYPYDGTTYGTRIITGSITPAITNAGSGKNGSVILMFG